MDICDVGDKVRSGIERAAAPDGRGSGVALDERERHELVADLLAALESRGAPEATNLLDLMRCERNLLDALATVRRQIAIIVQSSSPPPDA